LLNTSSRVPATGRTMVDSKKVQELLDQLRLSVPQDVKAAQEIIQKKDAIVNQAQLEARRIRGTVEEEFNSRVEQSEVLNAARHRADELVEDAKRKVNRLLSQTAAESQATQKDSDAYAHAALSGLERQLTTVLSTVRKGMETLDHNGNGRINSN